MRQKPSRVDGAIYSVTIGVGGYTGAGTVGGSIDAARDGLRQAVIDVAPIDSTATVNLADAPRVQSQTNARGCNHRGAGRPRMPEDERASETLVVKLTKADFDALDKLSAECDMSKAAIVRYWIREATNS